MVGLAYNPVIQFINVFLTYEAVQFQMNLLFHAWIISRTEVLLLWAHSEVRSWR